MLRREIIFSKVANPGVATFVKIKSFIVVFPDLIKVSKLFCFSGKLLGWVASFTLLHFYVSNTFTLSLFVHLGMTEPFLEECMPELLVFENS